MGNWQQALKNSVTTVDQLIELFGEENIDREAVQRAMDSFNLRITPAALETIGEAGDAFWRQYVPTPEENEVVDGVVDPLAEDADSPVPNITSRTARACRTAVPFRGRPDVPHRNVFQS